MFRGLLPQKAGTRITAHLSAAWGTIFGGQRVFCKVYTVGWVDFGLNKKKFAFACCLKIKKNLIFVLFSKKYFFVCFLLEFSFV